MKTRKQSELGQFLSARYSTSVQECTAKETKNFGRFYLVGSVPATCLDPDGSKVTYASEREAILAVLADPWIQATPDQLIQGADCRHINRTDYAQP